ncbi:MAG: MBOAT family protein [Nitrospirae bacterium]|nr:MBOAT family protein [Nitrospirota bacterium]
MAKSWLDLALFSTYFPHMIAGPIMRFNTLSPQLDNFKPISVQTINEGHFYFFRGILKKTVLADMLAYLFIDSVFDNPSNYSLLFIYLTTCIFAFQIYYDFSGYSDMAIGISKYFNIELDTNFKYPYFSESPREFWRNWHITLSNWFRDYIYIPVKGASLSKLRIGAALFLSFALSGIWHGAAVKFVLWGIYNAIGVLLCRKVKISSSFLSYRPVKIIYTFVFISTSWLLFRIPSISSLFKLKGLFIMSSETHNTIVCLLVILFCFIMHYLEKHLTASRFLKCGYVVQCTTYILILVFATSMTAYSKQFIYFQF